MIILENIKDGIFSLRINKIRLVLPMLSIMVGVGALVLISSVIEGEKRFISSEIEKLGARLISVSIRDMETAGFTRRDIKGLMNLCPEINQIIPISLTSSPIYTSNKSVERVQIAGVIAGLKEVTTIPLRMGRFFTNEEVDNLANVCVIGEKIYNKLFKNQYPIGQFLYIVKDVNEKINLRIIGVLDKTNQQIYGMIGQEGLFVPITVFQKKIVGGENISSLLVETETPEQVAMVVQRIKGIFGLKKIPAVVYAPKELLYARAIIDKKATIFGYALGVLLLIVGGVGIINIMLKSVIERTKEIGIRKAVGAKKRDILIQFLTEAFMIGILGCLLGTVIGIWGAHIVADSVIKTAMPVISIMIISISSSVAMSITILFGFYPSFKASTLNPIDALRYE